MDISIFDLQGKAVSKLTLDDALWGAPVRTAVLQQAVQMYRTNQRAGTASTKTRGDVSGGGKKPWKQKHTGRARAGSTRSPLWRHGGSVFGPRPRDMSYHLPQQIRRVALLESLKGKLRDEELLVLDQLAAEKPKTKPFGTLAQAFKVAGRGRAVIVLEQPSEALVKSLRNLAAFELRYAQNLNAFDVLNAHKIFVTKAAWDRLEARVRGIPDASSN
jgi:large subunit ribosomal protein L4